MPTQTPLTLVQARSQDLEKGGAILKEWEVCKRRWLEFSLALNQFQMVCPKFETKCLGKIGNSKVFSAQNQVISKKKKKKKKKKKRYSPKFTAIFLPISQLQTFEGGLFSNGGGYFPFFTENRPQKHKKHAFLHTSQAYGGGSSPPRPPLATLLPLWQFQDGGFL